MQARPPRLSVLVALSSLASFASLASLASLAACGAPPPNSPAPSAAEAPSTVEAAEGYTLSFPASVATRKGRDGRATFRIDASTKDGVRFEAAWFGFPEAIQPAEQQALLAQVEQGLTGSGSDIVSRGESVVFGRASLDLTVDRPDGRRVVHHILYPSSKAMLQVSVSGPRGGAWERDEPAFWSSLKLL